MDTNTNKITEPHPVYNLSTSHAIPVAIETSELSPAFLKLARVMQNQCAAAGSYVIELEKPAYAKDALDVTISRVDRVRTLKIDKDGERR